MNRHELLQQFSQSAESLMRIVAMKHGGDRWPKTMPPRAQMAVLFTLARHNDQTIKELSEHFGMTSSAATQLVNGLVSEGLLKRKQDLDDHRKVFAVLTPAGKKVLVQAKKLRIARMAETVEPLSDKELTQLIHLQEKIVAHFKNVCRKK